MNEQLERNSQQALYAALLKHMNGLELPMQQLDEAAKEVAVLETKISHYQKQLETLEPLVESGKLSQNKLDHVLEHSLATPRVNVTTHKFYKKFCDRAGIHQPIDGDDDVLLQESESTINTNCPVTQMEMQDPVRNPSCGHTYSKRGIQAHLRRSNECPVAGCKQTLSFNRLERDVEMEIVIARSHRVSKQKRS